tara:strand:- start:3277 stop:3429 length:153 start_codon:yes stop_codon:yes gene_type:complete
MSDSHNKKPYVRVYCETQEIKDAIAERAEELELSATKYLIMLAKEDLGIS